MRSVTANYSIRGSCYDCVCFLRSFFECFCVSERCAGYADEAEKFVEELESH